jgi:hypothetical protein
MNVDKITKALGVSVKDEMDAMDPDALRGCIVEAEQTIAETDAAMEADDKLNGAKEIVKDLRSAYTDVKKAQKAKTKYALYLLEEKGV